MLIAPANSQWSKDQNQRGTVGLIRWTHGLINRTVMIGDAALILATTLLCRVHLLGATPVLNWRECLLTAAVAATAFVGALKLFGLYRVERFTRPLRQLGDIIQGFVPAGLVAMLPLWAFRPAVLHTPHWLVAWAFAAMALLLLERQGARMLVRGLDRAAVLRRRVAIVGASTAGEDLVRRMKDPAVAPDYDVVGIFDDRMGDRRPLMIAGMPVSGTTADLITYAQRNPVDLIVVALPWDKSMAIFRLIQQVQWISADVVVPFDRTVLNPHTARLVDVAGDCSLQLMHRPFKGSQGLLKIVEDYSVAALGLLAASPIMLLAALAVWLDSPGPILFRQARVGFNGKPFMIYKFRTMTVDPTDDGSVGTTKHNPRITRVGAFLRRSSIDEIPQLLNVLTGDMSIVGPRPHVPKMRVGDEPYTEAVRWYAGRHRIKPGITGWAQINGMRGGIHSVAKAERGVELDLHYIKNWSLRLDLIIMFRTLIIGMFGRDVF